MLFKSCRDQGTEVQEKDCELKDGSHRVTLSEINLRRLAELEIWRRKYSKFNHSAKNFTVCLKRKTLLNWRKHQANNASFHRRGGEVGGAIVVVVVVFNFVGRTMPVCGGEESLRWKVEKSENIIRVKYGAEDFQEGRSRGFSLRCVCV